MEKTASFTGIQILSLTSSSIEKKKEEEYYGVIKGKFEDYFKAKFEDVYFEITANRISNKLKNKIKSRDIILFFLKKGTKSSAFPDITGFVNDPQGKIGKTYQSGFVVIEVKIEEITLDNIYQTRKYADLFDARYAFLVSLKEIPEEIKKLSETVRPLLNLPYPSKPLTLVHFDENKNEFEEWFPTHQVQY